MQPLAIALVTLVLGQLGKPLDGNWTASYQGTTYVRLTFTDGATALQGTMSLGPRIHVDTQGNVDSVTEAASMPTRIFDIRWSNGALSFGRDDGPGVDRYEFRLIDATHGELFLILSGEEQRQVAAGQIPLPKPFQLTKTP